MAQLDLTLRADLAEITRLRENLEVFAERQALPAGLVFRMTLVLDELLTNAIDYSFEGIAQPEIHVRIAIDRPAEHAMVYVRDNGRPFDPFREAPTPDLDTPLEQRRVGGLGIHFVRTMAERVDYRREDEWNVIELRMRQTSEAG